MAHRTRLLLIAGLGALAVVTVWVVVHPINGFVILALAAAKSNGFGVRLGPLPLWVFALLWGGVHLLLAAILRRGPRIFIWLFSLQALFLVLYLFGGLKPYPIISLPYSGTLSQSTSWTTGIVAQWWGILVFGAFLIVAVTVDRLLLPPRAFLEKSRMNPTASSRSPTNLGGEAASLASDYTSANENEE